jgi:hypothetical protein
MDHDLIKSDQEAGAGARQTDRFRSGSRRRESQEGLSRKIRERAEPPRSGPDTYILLENPPRALIPGTAWQRAEPMQQAKGVVALSAGLVLRFNA